MKKQNQNTDLLSKIVESYSNRIIKRETSIEKKREIPNKEHNAIRKIICDLKKIYYNISGNIEKNFETIYVPIYEAVKVSSLSSEEKIEKSLDLYLQDLDNKDISIEKKIIQLNQDTEKIKSNSQITKKKITDKVASKFENIINKYVKEIIDHHIIPINYGECVYKFKERIENEEEGFKKFYEIESSLMGSIEGLSWSESKKKLYKLNRTFLTDNGIDASSKRWDDDLEENTKVYTSLMYGGVQKKETSISLTYERTVFYLTSENKELLEIMDKYLQNLENKNNKISIHTGTFNCDKRLRDGTDIIENSYVPHIKKLYRHLCE